MKRYGGGVRYDGKGGSFKGTDGEEGWEMGENSGRPTTKHEQSFQNQDVIPWNY